MELLNSFVQKLLEELSVNCECDILVINAAGSVIAYTRNTNLDFFKHIIRQAANGKPPSSVSFKKAEDLKSCHPLLIYPVTLSSHSKGTIIISGNTKASNKLANIIKTSIETMVEYTVNIDQARSRILHDEMLIKNILSGQDNQDINNMSSSLKKLGVDLSMLRSVILIEFEDKANRYFNNSLDLGYDSSEEKLKDKLTSIIKQNKYLTNKDITAFYGNNQIIVLKSFLKTADLNKIYAALEKICTSILDSLNINNLFSFSIAFGNVYSDILDLRKSYIEASEIIKINKSFNSPPGVFTINNLLLESIEYYLPPIIIDMLIKPLIKKLKRSDGTIDIDLLTIVDKFIDCSYNYSFTSKQLFLHRNTISMKLEKFKAITGLNPQDSFRDAFITKMVIIYAKLHDLT